MDQKSKRAPAPGIDLGSLLRQVRTGLSGGGMEVQKAARESESLTTALLCIFNSNNGYEGFQNALANIDYTLADIEKICPKIKINNNTGLFISAAINKIITENDTVTLDFNGKEVNELAYRLQKGHVILNGPAGDSVGQFMSGSAHLTINGNAGNSAGWDMHGSASLTINGNAGDFAGWNMHGSASLTINGNAGDFAGQGMFDSTSLTIKQDAGDVVGQNSSGGTIKIEGDISSIADSCKAEVFHKGKRVRFRRMHNLLGFRILN